MASEILADIYPGNGLSFQRQATVLSEAMPTYYWSENFIRVYEDAFQTAACNILAILLKPQFRKN